PFSELFITPSDIQFNPPSPIENGHSLFINATVHNSGVSEQNVEVRFYNGDPDENGDLIPDDTAEIIANVTIDVDEDTYSVASIIWTPPIKDTYNIYVWVDPKNETEEYYYHNNLVTATEPLMIFDWVDQFEDKGKVFSSDYLIFHE
ncbi:MAG: hypothetical protein JSW28_05545, partial [Thermoplasmata archaeon]